MAAQGQEEWRFVAAEPGPPRAALPEDLFSDIAAEPNDDDWGDFAAPNAAPAPAGKHSAPPSAATFAKGQTILYLDGRSGSWVQVKVLHVDVTHHPPSYGIEMPNGAFRETEEHRLRPLTSDGTADGVPAVMQPAGRALNGNGAANSVPAAAMVVPVVGILAGEPRHAEGEDDDFGDFAAAAAGPSPPAPAAAAAAAAPAAPAVAAQPAPGSPQPQAGTAAAAAAAAAAGASQHRATSGPASPALRSFRAFLHSAASEVADQMDAEDDAVAATQHAQQGLQQRQQQQQQQVSELSALPEAASDDDFGDFAAAAAEAAAEAVQLQQDALPGNQPVAGCLPLAAAPPAMGAFGAAAGSMPAAAAVLPPAAAVPAGVRRDAPLPLDIFGEEDEEEVVEAAEAPAVPAAGISSWLAPGLPALPVLAAVALPAGAQPPAQQSPTTQRAFLAAGELHSLGGDQSPPESAPTVPAAWSAGEEDDDFADFQGPAPAAPVQADAPASPAHHAADAVPSTALHTGVAAAAAGQPAAGADAAPATDAPTADGWAGAAGGCAGFDSAGDGGPEAAHHLGQPAHDAWPPQQPGSVPRTWADRSRHMLAVDLPEGFVRTPPMPLAPAAAHTEGAVDVPAAAAVAGVTADWAGDGSGDGFADFSSAAPPQQQAAAAQDPAAGVPTHAALGQPAAGAGAWESAGDEVGATQQQHQQQQQTEVQEQLGERQQRATPASPSSGRRTSAVLSALHPVSPRLAGNSGSSGSGAPPLAARSAMLLGRPAAAATEAGTEVVTEYAVAWARLLQAAAALLHTSAGVWAEAGRQGAWRELASLPAAQLHLAACGQLYAAAAVVRLAAQQLGLFSLVPELQEGWGGVEAAWASQPAAPVKDAGAEARAGEERQDEALGREHGPAAGLEAEQAEPQQDEGAQAQQQPRFQDAVLSAAAAVAQQGAGADGTDALPLLSAVERAPAVLEALSLDDFPRLLEWSEGLCGVTLLPLSLFEGCGPVAPWFQGRPCLVPLANLWLRCVSTAPPQLD